MTSVGWPGFRRHPPSPGPLLQFIHSPHSWQGRTQVMLWPAGSRGLPQSKPGTALLPLGQHADFPSTSGLRKLPAACLYASAGEVPYLIGEQPALGYPACPGTGHQRSGGRMRSSPPHPHRGPHLHPAILVLSPAGKTLSPAPREEDRVPREMSRWPAASLPALRSSSVLREPCVSGGVGW